MNQMRYITCARPGSMVGGNMEMPERKAGQSLLKIRKIGICGTDIHAFAGDQPYFTYPRVLGHELAAEYVEGDAAGFSPGQPVTFIPYFHCGECIACRSGKTNCCSRIHVFGVHIDGGMKEYVVVPDEYLLHGDGLTYDQLALVEPLAIGAHGIRRGGVKEDDIVLVMGAGPIGLGLIRFAQMTGAKVVVIDINERRLRFASENFGVDAAINPLKHTVKEEIARMTNGDMASVVIDASGNQQVINGGIEFLAHGGNYVLVGLQKGNLIYNHPEFHKRETTLMSSRNALREDFLYVIENLKNGNIQADAFITHRLDFSTIPEKFNFVSNPENNIVKAIIDL